MLEAISDLLCSSESFSIKMSFKKYTILMEDVVEIESYFNQIPNTTVSFYDEPDTLGLRIEHINTMLKTSLTDNVKNKGVTND